MAMIEMDLDIPQGLHLCGSERIEQDHAFEVDCPVDDTFTCQRCRRSEQTHIHYGDTIHVIRDLDVWGQPSFFVSQPPCHRCGSCNYRQWLIPPAVTLPESSTVLRS